jgi:hypothetical protein
MKKGMGFLAGILFSFILLASSAQWASAVSLNGQCGVRLVPYCVFYDSSRTTVVGVLSQAAGTVHWVFCDSDGIPLKRGQFNVAANQQYGFIWAVEAGDVPAGTVGYLTFAMDRAPADGTLDNGENLSANAFYVDVTKSDVIFIPTVEATISALTNTDPNTFLIKDLDLAGWGYGTFAADLHLGYDIDGAPGGYDTNIIIFSAQDIASTQIIKVQDTNGNFAPDIAIPTPKKRLNIINPETVAGWPAGYHVGFIKWPIPAGTVKVYGFSIVFSTEFGAAQTLVGNWGHF